MGTGVDEKARERFLKALEGCYGRVVEDAVRIAWLYGGTDCSQAELLRRARDLVHETVVRILDGKRTWVPEKVPDFCTYMKQTVRSVASASLKKASRLESIDAVLETDDGDTLAMRQVASSDQNAEEQIIDKDSASALVNELLDAAQGDEFLEKVIYAYLEDDFEWPRQVAARLGVKADEISAAERKLWRRVMSARKKVDQCQSHG